MNKNHIIKSFKVSEEASTKFKTAVEETGLKSSQLSRLLFNRALQKLMEAGQLEELKARAKVKEHFRRLEKEAHQKEYRERPEIKARQKEWNKEYCKRSAVKERIKELKKTHEARARLNKMAMKRYYNNTQHRVSMLLRTRFNQALKQYTKTGKIRKSKTYGVNYKSIIEHLKPFPKKITKYHIDHIRPLCSFNLEDPKQIKIAFAPENHQWLLAYDNISKGGRWDEKEPQC